MTYRQRDDLHSHVLTEDEVAELMRMYRSGSTYKAIAEHFDIHRNTVRNIIDRVRGEGAKNA